MPRPGAGGTDRCRACSRCRELGLARIRDANRFLADPRCVRKTSVSRPTLSINRFRRSAYPRVAGAARDAGWEFHGARFTCRCRFHKVADQAGMIAKTMGEIAAFKGSAPAGLAGPGVSRKRSRRRTCC